MKEYKCIMTRDDKYKAGYPTELTELSKIIDDYENNGWHLHTYQPVYNSNANRMDRACYEHFLLFEKEKAS